METIGLDRGLEQQARHARPKEATTADESRSALANFPSILFETPPADISGDTVQPPPFFSDLNLDQIVDAITAGREEYRLKPFFYIRLNRLTEIAYRQEVMRDLEHEPLFAGVQSFSERMRTMRHHLAAAKNWHYKFSRERWFLDAVETYCVAVGELRRLLEQTPPASRGLRAVREYLSQYVESDRFQMLRRDAEEVKSGLSAIRYNVRLKGGSVMVHSHGSEADLTALVEETFAKFRQGAVKSYLCSSPALPGMNHVQAAILERVARLYPGVFQALEAFCVKHEKFLNPSLVRFDREIQFYVAYLEYLKPFRRAGLKFCYPEVSDTRKDICARETFDLSLAGKRLPENAPIVCNDFALTGPERIFVVTGPNQGGKTTFARMVGQLHYLASLGCAVPGAEARLFLADEIFTHFERRENLATLRGKLQVELARIHSLLEGATPASLVILNEIFSSTSFQDSLFLSKKVLERLSRLDAPGVWVTFLDELASFNEKTVSLVATVAPDDPTRRTYQIVRQPANGLAYALALAEKHRLTYQRLKARLKT